MFVTNENIQHLKNNETSRAHLPVRADLLVLQMLLWIHAQVIIVVCL